MGKGTKHASPNTVPLHRVLRAPPEKVYRAFLDAEALAKWLPPNGYGHAEKSFVRDGSEHSGRSVLSRLAGIVDPAGETRRSRNSGSTLKL
jgi:activator of Hsp90 ATPase-like protein